MTLILLPTVELEPSDWAEPGYEGLIGTVRWDEHWGRSLQRWHVTPISPGEWHISTEQLRSEETLTRLLLLQLEGRGVVGFPAEDGEVDVDEERIPAMYGGYALFDAAGKTVALPSCCCDLGDLGTWRDAATLVEGASMMLGMGHGQWSAQRDGANILLTQQPEWGGHEPILAQVSAHDLLAATHVAELALEAFRGRVLPMLLRLVSDAARAESLSRLLVGLPLERAPSE